MPTYLLQHLTRYSYEDPVSVCHHLAHLLPREAPGHAWWSEDLDITPAPAIRAERLDYFGNRLTFFAIQEPHRQLSVFSQAKVDLTVPPPPEFALFGSPPWEQAREQIDQLRFSFPTSSAKLTAVQYQLASPYIQWNEEIAAYAAVSFTPGRPIVEAAMDLMARIFREFAYDTKSTDVTTTLPEVMKARAGVCQDFAHLIIGALRSQGLPARYVSGYLLTTPPPGKPRLVGADASHAWASLYLPGPDGGTWLDLDPTNNVIPSDKHITLAWGRDFGDVSPIRGVILGGGRHTVQVNVDVSPV